VWNVIPYSKGGTYIKLKKVLRRLFEFTRDGVTMVEKIAY
jgi:hypothetical protein